MHPSTTIESVRPPQLQKLAQDGDVEAQYCTKRRVRSTKHPAATPPYLQPGTERFEL